MSLLVISAGLTALIAANCGDGVGRPATTTLPAVGETSGPQVAIEAIPAVARSWATDWTKRNIDLRELMVVMRGDNPRNVGPLLNSFDFETVEQADQWLEDEEPGVFLQLGNDARFYPLRILTPHEIVNDELAGRPVLITFCLRCKSSVAFERTVDGRVLRFGTSGLLRFSDPVMWDDVTESLWQRFDGSAVVGEMVGKSLDFLPSRLIPWSEFKAGFPDGRALSKDTDFGLNYGSNEREVGNVIPRRYR